MRTLRALVLNKETLSELTATELAGVAGGDTALCPTNNCHTRLEPGCLISRAIDPCVTYPCTT